VGPRECATYGPGWTLSRGGVYILGVPHLRPATTGPPGGVSWRGAAAAADCFLGSGRRPACGRGRPQRVHHPSSSASSSSTVSSPGPGSGGRGPYGGTFTPLIHFGTTLQYDSQQRLPSALFFGGRHFHPQTYLNSQEGLSSKGHVIRGPLGSSRRKLRRVMCPP